MDNNEERHLSAVPDEPAEAWIPPAVDGDVESSTEEQVASESVASEPTEQATQVTDENWWIEVLPDDIRANIGSPQWRIASPDAFAWAEERFYEVYAQKSINDAQAEKIIEKLQAEIDRVREVNERRNKPFVNALAFFEGHMTAYALGLRQQDASVKSVKGIYLNINTRAVEANFDIVDKALFEKFLTDNNKQGWFAVEVKPDKKAIKEAVAYQDGNVIDTSTGAVIEGLVAVPASIGAKVKIDIEKDAKGNLIVYPINRMYLLTEQEAGQ